MKLPGTCSQSNENEFTGNMLTIKGELSYREHAHYQRSVMKKKKNGTPILGEWDSYFLAGTLTFYKKRESRTPTFKILVRTLLEY